MPIDQYIHHYIPVMLNFFHHHVILGEIFTFVMAFLEALPIIGTIVPGSVTMTLVGILVGTGSLPGILTFNIACAGAYTGDCVGFAFGRIFQGRVQSLWPFSKYPKWLTISEDFFDKHGVKGVIFGRFFGPIRSTVPMVAGIFKMSWRVFLFAGIPSAVIWAAIYMGPGIVLGKVAMQLPAAAMTKFLLISLSTLVVIWLACWLITRFFTQFSRIINLYVDKLWEWLHTHQHTNKIIKFILNKTTPKDHKQLLLLLISLVSLLLFLLLFLSISHKHLLGFNHPVFHFLQSVHTYLITQASIYTTNLGYYRIVLVLSAIIALGLAIKKQWRAACHLLAAIWAGVIAIAICKHLYHSPRPYGFMIVKPSSSFPSGHTTMGVILFGMLSYYSAIIFNARKKLFHTISLIIMLLLGLSRLYLGAHWLTDIIGAYLLGCSILLSSILHFRRGYHAHIKVSRKYWLTLCILSIILVWLPYSIHTNAHHRYQYTPNNRTILLTQNQWWKSKHSLLPIYRKSRFGHAIQPLNIQWNANLSKIKQSLLQNKFTLQNPKSSLARIVKGMTNNTSYQQPLFSWQYHNQPPVLLATKKIDPDETILEIRLWKSFHQFQSNQTPLWVGSVNFHHAKKGIQTAYKRISYEYKQQSPLEYTKKLQEMYSNKEIHAVNINRSLSYMHWNGTILILKEPRR